jgi:hypothetical protein
MFSESLMRAMAASLNVQVVVAESGDDIDSVDLTFNTGRFGPNQIPLGPERKLEVQLKCTTSKNLTPMEDPGRPGVEALRYYLSVKDHVRLAVRKDRRTYPHVLIVVQVSGPPIDWLRRHGHLTLLRARAWWVDLADQPPAVNKVNVPIFIPKRQVFDVRALDALMAGPQ